LLSKSTGSTKKSLCTMVKCTPTQGKLSRIYLASVGQDASRIYLICIDMIMYNLANDRNAVLTETNCEILSADMNEKFYSRMARLFYLVMRVQLDVNCYYIFMYMGPVPAIYHGGLVELMQCPEFCYVHIATGDLFNYV